MSCGASFDAFFYSLALNVKPDKEPRQMIERVTTRGKGLLEYERIPVCREATWRWNSNNRGVDVQGDET